MKKVLTGVVALALLVGAFVQAGFGDRGAPFPATQQHAAQSGRTEEFFTRGEKIILRDTRQQKIAGRTVRTRDSNIELHARDRQGRPNYGRMARGLAPIGLDGKPVVLHHLRQEDDAVIVEVLASEHYEYYKDLHSYKKESEIRRSSFDRWRNRYWKKRGDQLCR
ncbi:MAG TPA: hypothetical protein IAB01_01265 [Candidatus Avidesulfovibrio excrementigallinarum]|nr:hypothetical protein [Candidatus Avidesulfovibrio excrementigallinarum]